LVSGVRFKTKSPPQARGRLEESAGGPASKLLEFLEQLGAGLLFEGVQMLFVQPHPFGVA
jgi:hypothetical protein